MSDHAPNQLIHETSPYLRQHANNPVDWYPWGKEALEKARRENKPIFLSIGYSACHWCHVMEKESFEDPETATLMNEHFINIKVDREERQDLDHIYMSAVQIMTHQGGWPMSVFLTPKLQPFYGGTYFPPEDRHGIPAFKKVLLGVANAWKTRREEVTRSAEQLVGALKQMQEPQNAEGGTPLTRERIRDAVRQIARAFDSTYGGFGTAPKFFHTTDLHLALRHWALDGDPVALTVVRLTLDKIRRGGIYDQLGGGFHRYSTDEKWLVPHFEKMLYDNALLLELYADAYAADPQPLFAETVLEIVDWLDREMTSPDGAFFSTQDADTEGEEGKYYVWSEAEIRQLLDAELADAFVGAYPVTAEGNWEGKNILTLTEHSLRERAELAHTDEETLREHISLAKRRLLKHRTSRVHPHRDEKILLAWNATMISGLCSAHQALGDTRSLRMAQNAADFLLEALRSPAQTSESSPLYFHTCKDGKSRLTAYLDDYAALGLSLLRLYESDFNLAWIDHASGLAKTVVAEFWDEASGSFYFTGTTHETLITRPKEATDGATPSATGLAATFLARLGRLTDQQSWITIAEKTLATHREQMERIPTASGQLFLCLAELLPESTQEWVFAGGLDSEQNEELLKRIRATYQPGRLLMHHVAPGAGSAAMPLVANKTAIDQKPTLYVCRNKTCLEPWVGEETILRELAEI